MGKHQQLPKRGTCGYCGGEGELTTDHVIPRCLFAKPIPDDVPKVRACTRCNGASKGSDDTYLRDMLVRDAQTAQHPVAQNIRHDAFARSTERSHYLRDASRLRLVPVSTESGLLIYRPLLPKERLRGIFIRLTQGLMLAYEGYSLPQTTYVDVFRATDPTLAVQEAERWADMDRGGMVHTKRVGDGSIFSCVYYHSLQQPDLSMWWLRFYEHAVYRICTDMSNLSLGEF